MRQQLDTVGKNIMRRVYYAYALRLATHKYTLHGVVLIGLLYVLGALVHVRAVVENFAAVEVRNIDAFIYSMLTNTEIWTLVTFVALLLLAVSFIRSLVAYRHQTLHFA